MAENSNNNKNGLPNKPNGKPNGKPGKAKNFYWIYAAIGMGLIFMLFMQNETELKEISMLEFEQEMMLKKHVEKITIVNEEFAEVTIKKDKLQEKIHSEKHEVSEEGFNKTPNPGPHYRLPVLTVESFAEKITLIQEKLNTQDTINKAVTPAEFEKLQKENYVPLNSEERRDWSKDVMGWVIPLIFIIALWFFLMRMMSRGGAGGGQIFNIGKSKAQLFDRDSSVKINFNDVAGLEEAKVEIKEIVDFLKNPKKYTNLGGKIPKGALLVGPPGTGKTLLAKAVAGEAKVPFFSLSGSDFVEMFVGVGASRVRDLFKQAKEKAPCIIFIDEIDAIGRARGRNQVTGANDERENTLNQLLTEMDGFATNAGVIILAATNRADILDRALLRAGRFDRQIHVELPDIKEREAIFKVHLRPLKKINEKLNVDFLAKQTPGFSGADIANVCNEAALIAARKNKENIDKQDFLDAIDRIIGGLEKRNKIISKDEKKVIAYHEAGHAAVSWLTKYASPLIKVTIIPRGKALGAAWYLPEERQITTYDQMFDEITATLGGRASEDIIFGKVSTGALNDLERVTKQVYAMVVYYGLNEKIGNISFYDSTGQQEYNFHKPYSEKTAELIDQEIKGIVEQAYQRAVSILSENKDKLDELAKVLLKKEVIFKEDVEKIFGPRPFEEKKEEEAEAVEENAEAKAIESTEVSETETTEETQESKESKE